MQYKVIDEYWEPFTQWQRDCIYTIYNIITKQTDVIDAEAALDILLDSESPWKVVAALPFPGPPIIEENK